MNLPSKVPDCLDAANQRVADLDAFEVRCVENAVHVLELVEDRGEADGIGTGVVDQVRRVAAEEPRLQFGRDLGRRRDVDR